MRTLPLPLVALVLSLSACDGGKTAPEPDDSAAAEVDPDGDGVSNAAGDCAPEDPAVYPGAEEVCDGKDNDCDGIIEDVPTRYTDADGDGYGAGGGTASCEAAAGTAEIGGDCDDGDPAIHPAAAEVCDGADQDCDGASDEGLTVAAYTDGDGDGYGAGDPAAVCAPGPGQSLLPGDCDDIAAEIRPGAAEVCDGADNDCDGSADEGVTSLLWADVDGDGYGDADLPAGTCQVLNGYVANPDDCDDGDASVNPGAAEVCGGIDEDCDGAVDDGDPDLLGATAWSIDYDGDGYGSPAFTLDACEAPAGYVADDTDCDDTDPGTRPGAAEVCDGADQDCDGTADEGAVDPATFHLDYDGDGHGGTAFTLDACEAPAGYVAGADDCDDTDAAIHPGAAEVCDGADQDCDGAADDGAVGGPTWHIDYDGDGYGSPGAYDVVSCAQPAGWVSDDTDCDDTATSVNPAGIEQCNGYDDDCDGLTDDDDAVAGPRGTFYADADGDGYGGATVIAACGLPAGAAGLSGDCDDTDAAVSPGAGEVAYDGIDQDCDGTDLRDADGDGAEAAVVGGGACGGGDDGIAPGAGEVCDGIDQDCDGSVDEGLRGVSLACPAESCAAILADIPYAASGDYYLEAGGAISLYACDMATDGGGWTEIVSWDREYGTDSAATLRAVLTERYNNMGLFRDRTGYVEWADYDNTGGYGDVLAMERAVEVPNGGEARFDLHYSAWSMDGSGTFFYVSGGGTDTSLYCDDDVLADAAYYTTAELAWRPTFCTSHHGGSYTWSGTAQVAAPAEIDTFHLRSLHSDSYGDASYLYAFALWVR